jgi:tetratricopeptide (TPR) repeat protein
VRPRRNRFALEDEVNRATSSGKKAVALYQLGVFHDNNTREALAIPLYEKALRVGLDPALKARALAWLASNLYKTGRPKPALSRVRQARGIAKDRELRKFLDGLEARILRSLNRS